MVSFKTVDLDSGEVREPTITPPSNPKTDTAPGTPPRRRGRPPGSKNKSSLLPVSEIEDGISQFMTLAGFGLSMVDAYDGSVLIKQAGPLSKAIAQMAAKDKKMHAQLTKALRAGSYAAVATAGIPIAMAIGANHGILPDMFLMDTGVEPTLYGRANTQFEEGSNIEAQVAQDGPVTLHDNGHEDLGGLGFVMRGVHDSEINGE